MKRSNTDPKAVPRKIQKSFHIQAAQKLMTAIQKYGTGLCLNGLICKLPYRYDSQPFDEMDSLSSLHLWELRQVFWHLVHYTQASKYHTVCSYAFKHVVENQADQIGVGNYISNGIAILAYKMLDMQGKRIIGPNMELCLALNFENKKIPCKNTLKRGVEWNTRKAKKFAGFQVKLTLFHYLPDEMRKIVDDYLDIPHIRLEPYHKKALSYIALLDDMGIEGPA